MKREFVQKYAFGIAAFFWALTILPSALFPHWAFLDDVGLLLEGSYGLDYPYNYLPNEKTGRFCPAYQLYYCLVHFLFGFELSGYYLVQSAVFLGGAAFLYQLGRRLAGSRWAGLLACLLFFTASPVAENAYTLGKPEPRLALLMLGAFWLFSRRMVSSNTRRSPLDWCGVGLFILLAILTKETAVAVIVFGGLGMAATVASRPARSEKWEAARGWMGFLFTAAFVAVLARSLYRILLPPDASNSYTRYSITADLIWENGLFYLRQTPDILVLGAGSLVVGLWAFFHSRGRMQQRAIFHLALAGTGWAYLGGMLLWRWPLGYYLLVPAALFSVPAAAVFFQKDLPAPKRKILWTFGFLLLLTRAYTIPYGIYVAKAQKSVDRHYTQLMTAYAEEAREGQRLLIEDWPFYVEPVDKSNRLLSQIWNQSGLKVLGIQGLLENRRVAPEILKLHHAQAPDPADRFPRKGDFYARWTGERAVPWVVRGVSPFRKSSESDGLTPTGLQLKQLQSRKTEWKGLVWGPSRPVPTIQTFSAGYQMFQVKEASVVFWEEGRWNDGWMGKNAVCRIGMTERAVPFRAILQAPPAGAPGRIQVFQEETRIAVREWSEPGAVSIPLILSATDAVGTRLRFELDRTFVPRQIGTGADDRALGVMLNIQKEPEFRWTDRWSDGWIGKHSVCHVFWPGRGPLTVRFSGDAIPRAVPQEIAVRGEGVPPQTVSIPSAGAFAFEVTAMPKKGPPRYIPIRLQAHRTVNPKALGQSADDRDLSVQISARRLPGTAGNLETTAAAEGTP